MFHSILFLCIEILILLTVIRTDLPHEMPNETHKIFALKRGIRVVELSVGGKDAVSN